MRVVRGQLFKSEKQFSVITPRRAKSSETTSSTRDLWCVWISLRARMVVSAMGRIYNRLSEGQTVHSIFFQSWDPGYLSRFCWTGRLMRNGRRQFLVPSPESHQRSWWIVHTLPTKGLGRTLVPESHQRSCWMVHFRPKGSVTSPWPVGVSTIHQRR